MNETMITVRETDFNCNGSGRESEAAAMERLGLGFPGLYDNPADLAQLAITIRKLEDFPVCMLPFCYTLEAEAMGGCIQYGDATSSPRVRDYAYLHFDDLSGLPNINMETPRIQHMLAAARQLKEQGETVAIEVCGPISILNNLMDLPVLLKGWRKKPDLMSGVLAHLCEQAVRYAKEVRAIGVDILCYADPTGSYSILGPNFSRMLAEGFVLPFLRGIAIDLQGDSILHLCPKTGTALVAQGLARWQEIPAETLGLYANRVLAVKGKALIVGETCIRDRSRLGRDTINELIINEI